MKPVEEIKKQIEEMAMFEVCPYSGMPTTPYE